MSILLTFVVSVLGIIGGKFLFKHWINHLTIYSVIWGGLIILYEMKLLPYVDLTPLVWFYIIIVFLCIVFGVLTVTSIRNLSSEVHDKTKGRELYLPMFKDDGRAVKYTILLFSTIAILAAIQHWIVLIDYFGSFTAALINANLIYKLNFDGEVKGVIPYVSNLGYVAIFFSGLYAAYKGKFSFLVFLPFIGIVLKSMATAGRVGMLFALIEFCLTFFLFRYLLKNDSETRFKFSKSNALIASSILIVFIVLSASLIRVSRITDEDMPGTSQELKQLEDNFIITPTIYLYLSCDLGVLTQYLKTDGEDTGFGEHTFMLVHYYLSRLNLIEKPESRQKNYYTPIRVNTGTYIRELHADFGNIGVFLVPYLLSLLITWLWFKFYEQYSILVLVLLIYLNLVLVFSFISMITRLDIWGLSIFMALFSVPLVERMAISINKNCSLANQQGMN